MEMYIFLFIVAVLSSSGVYSQRAFSDKFAGNYTQSYKGTEVYVTPKKNNRYTVKIQVQDDVTIGLRKRYSYMNVDSNNLGRFVQALKNTKEI